MFTFETHTTSSTFIRQQKMGTITLDPEVSVCLVEFDSAGYSDACFNQLAIPFPEILQQAVAKRRANYLAGRYAASQLLLHKAGCNRAVEIGTDRAPVWPAGWRGSISHTEKWALAILAPLRFHLILGVDIETLRPEIMREIATSFTTASERDVLVASGLPFETALLIAFSAKESLFKALYPWVRHFFGFEAAKLCGLSSENNHFTLELTRQLAPGLYAGYRTTGQYLLGKDGVITIIVASDPMIT